ncbi:TonB-dependent receptor [Flavobacterium sp. NRK F10]|uniref:TonB-dependent receptor domain-containing protein n=1 Tax=Flavobacterium sp. NRK F10 TaxID=2954931 RepID=UPI002091E078|nr:TonB-dependent receptor [Flavobacterium sp. NRK F10]MCO6174112.1 TonB-dependent receptor [Flavobacterium sp. NRK F10]
MKVNFLILLFLSNLMSLFAQNSGSVSGKVTDKKTGEPLPYVTVVVKDNAEMLTGSTTTDSGNFEINKLPLQKLSLEIQFIGYKTIVQVIDLSSSKKIDLGTITIEEDVSQLEGVEVVKERSIMEQKIDRKVINVGKDLISAGATAGEIMNNIPSVSVDPQTNEISLRGNSNVRVLLDGKPTNIPVEQLMKQIPSASIKQIELITNPSAKYNPEGMSGIINIVLHKNANDGFNGSVNNGITFGKTPKTNNSLDMNYRKGKLNFYTNYGFNHGFYANEGHLSSFQSGNESEQSFDIRNKNTSHLWKFGTDYYINDKNTLSVYTTQNWFSGDADAKTFIDYLNPATTDIAQNFSAKSNGNTQVYNLDFKHDFAKEDENIELEINYNTYSSPEDSFYYYPLVPSSTTNNTANDNKNFKANLDYVNPLTKTTKLELGAEARIESTTNNLYIDQLYNSDFKYDRNIFSAYGTFAKQWDKWNFQIGARLEHYQVDAIFKKSGQDDVPFDDTIFTVYPSGFVSYTPNEKGTFNFSYSRRVDRPSIGQVNPIREWTTPTLDSEGNPYLEPQFTNSFELNYTRTTKIGSFTSGIFYRRINDEITRVMLEHPTDPNKNVLTFDNFKDNNAYGAEISGNLNFTKWWSANFGIDAYFRTLRGYVGDIYVEKNATLFNARANNTFKATKDLRFQLFGFYRGKDVSLQMTRKTMWRSDIGASYNVLKGQGTISARFSDIFHTMKAQFENDLPYPQVGKFTWESQTLYIGFNYRFGGGKNRALQRKQRDKNETQGGGGMF